MGIFSTPLESRINKNKNLETVIEAFARAKKISGKNAYVVIFGGNAWDINHYDSYMAKLSRLAKDLEVSDSVFFLGAQKGESAFPVIDVFVQASYYESFSLSTLEAMACAKPCILSDIPTLKEISGGNQKYFDPNSHEELADRMLEIMAEKDIQELSGMAKNSASNFSWEKHNAMIANIILRIKD